MKITARQVREFDILDNAGVLAKIVSTDRRTVEIFLISAGGIRTTRTLPGNTVLEVGRGDEIDPTNNPYWWGLEAEKERAEDLRAEIACDCSWHSRCWEHRVEAARNVAHRGANAMHRELHRALND